MTLLKLIRDLFDGIVNFYAKHRAYFDLAQFVAGMAMLIL